MKPTLTFILFSSFVLLAKPTLAAPIFNDGELSIQPDGKFEIGYPWKDVSVQTDPKTTTKTLKFSYSSSVEGGPEGKVEAGIKDGKVHYVIHSMEGFFPTVSGRAKTAILFSKAGFTDCRANPRSALMVDKAGKLVQKSPNNKKMSMAIRCTYVSLEDCRKFAPRASVPSEEGLIDLSDEYTKARKGKTKPPTADLEILKSVVGVTAKNFDGQTEDIEHDSFTMLEYMPARCLTVEELQ